MPEYGPPANRLLFENDYTRVWEMVVEVGESFPMHAHQYPYLSIVLEASSLVLIDGEGRETPLELEVGEVIWHDIPDVHAVRNVGPGRFRNRLVEFKTAA